MVKKTAYIALTLLFFSNIGIADINDGLVGYWNFDDGTATDNSGNGNDGVIHGTLLTEGVSGNTLSFDGLDDYVDMGDVLDPELSSWSISVWYLKQTPSTSMMKIVNKNCTVSGTPQNTGYQMRTQNGNLEFHVADQWNNWWRINTFEPSIHQWHHVVGTLDRELNEMRLYVDGVEVGFLSIDNIGDISSNIPFAIGSLHRGQFGVTSEFFNGLIDEVRIYNRVLNCTEARELHDLIFNPADFNHDRSIGISDLHILASEWLQTENLLSDIYPVCGDGIVDMNDFVEFASNWF